MSFSKENLSGLRKATNINALKQKMEEKTKDYTDNRFWILTMDDAKNGSATVRFLPFATMKEGDLPYIKQYSHEFSYNNRWYIELCRTSIGEDDPVVDHCNELWETGEKEKQELARQRKRKLSYIANIYIVDDPAKPENNGKVFLFKFGKRIHDKLMDSIKPEFEDEETPAINPFDLFEGANVKLRLNRVDGQASWSKTTISKQSAFLDGDEDAIVEVINKTYDLAEFLNPSRFKSYEDLQKRLNYVLGTGKSANGSVSAEAAARSGRTAEAPSARAAEPDDEGYQEEGEVTDDDVDAFFNTK